MKMHLPMAGLIDVDAELARSASAAARSSRSSRARTQSSATKFRPRMRRRTWSPRSASVSGVQA
jgi:hypothetical protein